MTKKVPRLKSLTGVPGLDAILGGGLPANRLYVLNGPPGSGKTTLALQYLLTGAALGEKGLYITLSETADELSEVAESHGWDLDGLAIFELSALEQQLAEESENTVFHPSEIQLNKTTELLLARIKQETPVRLVIDSLSELRLLSDTPHRYRRQMLAFKQFFAGYNTTVMLLDDHGGRKGSDLHVQSIAHGVITLEQLETNYGADHRRIKINKLRGTAFVGGYHDAVVEHGGLRVFPRLIAAQHGRDFKSETVSSALPHLDELLGGGLIRGTSCLLLGPAGTGKSTIALQFAVAAAGRGEKTAFYLFEESLRTLVDRGESTGLPISKLTKQGLLDFHQIDAGQLAPGQFVEHVRSAVEKDHAQYVVIDSLNGYLQAMPNVHFLEIQLHELFSFLNHHGVVSVMTVAQHGLLGQMNAPVDITYLADTVILLRFFEDSGRVKKAISVVKKRVGGHEDTIREFRVGKSGVQVGGPLENFQGVLSGIPRFSGSKNELLPRG